MATTCWFNLVTYFAHFFRSYICVVHRKQKRNGNEIKELAYNCLFTKRISWDMWNALHDRCSQQKLFAEVFPCGYFNVTISYDIHCFDFGLQYIQNTYKVKKTNASTTFSIAYFCLFYIFPVFSSYFFTFFYHI